MTGHQQKGNLVEYLVKVNDPNAVTVHPEDGTVTIESDGDRFVIDCASDGHAFDLIASIGKAREWRAEHEQRQMERAHDVDWFDVARHVVGNPVRVDGDNYTAGEAEVVELGRYTPGGAS